MAEVQGYVPGYRLTADPQFDEIGGRRDLVDPAFRHDVLAGLALLAASRTGPVQLPPDWTSLRQIKPQPAKNFPPVFGYNAVRIPPICM